MTRVAVIIVASLALTGCSSFSVGDWVPSMSGGGSIPLRLESDPPGAEARMSTGQSCRAPCTITVPAANGLTATFGLAGYESQTIPVDLVPGSAGAHAAEAEPVLIGDRVDRQAVPALTAAHLSQVRCRSSRPKRCCCWR